MQDNLWWVNIVTNLISGSATILVIVWIVNRILKQNDDRFQHNEEKIDKLEEEIKEVVEDKNNYRINNASLLAKMETQLNNVFEFVKDIKKKVFND